MEFIHPPGLSCLEPMHDNNGLIHWKECNHGPEGEKKRRYSRSAGSDVKNEMHRYKKGTAKSGRSGKGGKVKSRKQAIAIGLSKARKKGKKVPKKKSRS